MNERRYSDAEVAAIFERATKVQQSDSRQLPAPEGLTLEQVQEIGREVGIQPEHIARAAHALTHSGRETARHFLGLPIGVGRTVDLGRALSHEEWERLVVDLRETFDARGVQRAEGSFRQWTNGNLQALLEPTASGHQLRLRTTKGEARGMLTTGLMLVAVAAGVALASIMRGNADPGSISSMATLSVGGIAMFATAAFSVPGWARLRRAQMAAVVERLTSLPATSRPPLIADE